MKLRHLALLSLAPFAAFAADKFTVTVTHDLDIARPSETISIPWKEVNQAMPSAIVQKIAVKDSAGRVLPYQVTNVAPLSKDPRREGIAYGELLFQYDFPAGQKSATFTVERTQEVSPVFPTKAFARYVPERLDDFAWENDRVAHRLYGPALAEPDRDGKGKEVLVTSGIDVWCKRVPYMIVDRWYNKGHDHYHVDQGEGMDMYGVGTSRGCGGTGVWDGTNLWVGRNYKSWKVIANGPVRAVFELTYDAWATNGTPVAEIKRYTVDAGHNLDRVESTFHFAGNAQITAAVGLTKNSGDRGQEGKVEITRNEKDGFVSVWDVQKTNGSLGTAIVMIDSFAGFAEDERNTLALAKAASAKPIRFLVGAGWSKSGHFSSKDDWNAYVASESARAKSPVKYTIAVAQ